MFGMLLLDLRVTVTGGDGPRRVSAGVCESWDPTAWVEVNIPSIQMDWAVRRRRGPRMHTHRSMVYRHRQGRRRQDSPPVPLIRLPIRTLRSEIHIEYDGPYMTISNASDPRVIRAREEFARQMEVERAEYARREFEEASTRSLFGILTGQLLDREPGHMPNAIPAGMESESESDYEGDVFRALMAAASQCQ